MGPSTELGTLVVVVLKAQNLPDKHSFWKQDAYATISLSGTTKRTAVDVKGGQHPVWDEELRFPVLRDAKPENRTLDVTCWAKEPKADDNLGQGKLDITNTLKTGEFDEWIKLEQSGGYRGEIYIEMTFYANAPVPLARRASKFPVKDRLTRSSQPYKYTGAATQPKPISKPNSNTSSPHSSPGHVPPQLAPGRGPPPTSPKGTHLVPPSSRSPSASPKGRDAKLSALSEEPAGMNGKPQHVPSILRPGNPKSSPTPVARSDQPVPPRGGTSRPPPALSAGQGAAEHPPPSSILSSSGYPPPPPHGSVSFPMPVAGRSSTYDPTPNYNPYDRRPPPMQEQDDALPDPYLSVRYQTPLPLPGSPSPLPLRSDPTAIQAEARRIAREEEAKRRAQEEADMALARELDRELNLGGAGSAGHMPGEW